jgi:THO complex subunit 5
LQEETVGDEHMQKLARLEWELEQRKQLASQSQELLKNKETVAADITKQTDYLDNICPQLLNLMKVIFLLTNLSPNLYKPIGYPIA